MSDLQSEGCDDRGTREKNVLGGKRLGGSTSAEAGRRLGNRGSIGGFMLGKATPESFGRLLVAKGGPRLLKASKRWLSGASGKHILARTIGEADLGRL